MATSLQRPPARSTPPPRESYHASALDVIQAAMRAPAGLLQTALDLAVLVAVAMHAHGTRGVCWASVATLALEARCCERSVQRVLRRLTAAGILSAEEDGSRTTRYRILLDALTGAASPGGVTQSQGGGDTQSPDQVREEVIDPPPQPPRNGGAPDSDLRSPEPDPQDDPPAPPAEPLPLRAGNRAAVEWVAARALVDLAEGADRWSAEQLAEVLTRYRDGNGRLVDVYAEYSRPRAVKPGVLERRWADAPEGLRRREIRAGLRVARERWLARADR